MQASCFCSQSNWSTAPAGGLSVFCLHSGAVFKIVFRGQKICLRYFKIGQTYFEICALYFFFAPMRGKRTENQFSFFPSRKRPFYDTGFASPFVRLVQENHRPATRHTPPLYQIQRIPLPNILYFVLFIRQNMRIFVLHTRRNHEQNCP